MSDRGNSTENCRTSASDVTFGARQIRTAFLDRDGTINIKAPEGSYIRSWDGFHLLPGAAEAILRLNRAGVRVLVVTNQRGVALGQFTMADVDTIHKRLQEELKSIGARVDGFYVCPHEKNACDCRKPLTGLFRQARQDFPEISGESSVMVGDSLSDVEFGKRAGMFTIYIKRHLTNATRGSVAAEQIADFCCASLDGAVDLILEKQPK